MCLRWKPRGRGKCHADDWDPQQTVGASSAENKDEQAAATPLERKTEQIALKVARRVHKLEKRLSSHGRGSVAFQDDGAYTLCELIFRGLRARDPILHSASVLEQIDTAIEAKLRAAGYINVNSVTQRPAVHDINGEDISNAETAVCCCLCISCLPIMTPLLAWGLLRHQEAVTQVSLDIKRHH